VFCRHCGSPLVASVEGAGGGPAVVGEEGRGAGGGPRGAPARGGARPRAGRLRLLGSWGGVSRRVGVA